MSNLNVNELDFDAVKANLIEFLNTQSEFTDYDFTGSALNTLMDVCAYLIHYVGVQANFSLREGFLESAQLRKNVSARAKELGYFPSQAKAGRANFGITLDIALEAQPSEIIIPKGTTFVSTLEDGSSLTFVTFDDNPLVDTGLSANLPATGIWAGTVYVAQGIFANQYWTVDSSDQRFLMNQEGIDTDFLTIAVRPTEASMSSEQFVYGKNVTEVGPATNAYFLNEDDQAIEAYFGNNIIGAALSIGNYITAEYLVTAGKESNGLKVFSLNQNIEGYDRQLFVIDNATTTTDAADRESIESIRYLAPLGYSRQNRIVTIEDYKTAVLENYSNIKAINAWGGQDAQPPEYGKVFVSVAPVVGEFVSPTTKKSIEDNVLTKFSVVGITPEIVDPEYLIVNCITTVTYNKDKTTSNASEISSLVKETIDAHFDLQVFDYNQSFKYSKMLAAVDDTHEAITHSLSQITIAKSFTPTGNVSGTYELKFYNALTAATVESNEWTGTNGSLYQLKDNGNGQIDLYTNGSVTKNNQGSVDYTTGVIAITAFNPNALTPGAITVKVQPLINDIEVKYNNLAQLGTNTVTSVVEVR
jgi:hypothetical protein